MILHAPLAFVGIYCRYCRRHYRRGKKMAKAV